MLRNMYKKIKGSRESASGCPKEACMAAPLFRPPEATIQDQTTPPAATLTRSLFGVAGPEQASYDWIPIIFRFQAHP